MSDETTTSKATAAYLRLTQGLCLGRIFGPPQAAPVQAEADYEYQQIRDELPGEIQESLDRLVPGAVAELPLVEARWCLCESPEGEFARVRIFKDFESLLRYWGRLEGVETCVWSFYGVAMRMTRFLARYDGRIVLLPGEQEAILLPRSPREPLRRIALSLLDLRDEDFQTNGWMGLPGLAEAGETEYCAGDELVRQQQAAQAQKHKKRKPGDDQEDGVPREP